MVDVRPFKGLRPKPEFAEKIASLPYDVMSSEEAREIARDNPLSYLHVVKPEIDLPPDVDLYSDEVYEQGAKNLKRLINAGYMCQDVEPRYYVYRQIMGGHSQIGLVALASVEEYDKDIIKKHELTRKKKEDDRTRHISTQNAQSGPVFLTYKHRDDIDGAVAKVVESQPTVDFTADDGVRHTFWIITDAEIEKTIRDAFRDIDCLYVADGHHRSASASRVRAERMTINPKHTGEEEYNFFLTVIFPDNQMNILDYNRVVKDLNGMREKEFIQKIADKFHIYEIGGEPYKPAQKHEFGMLLGNMWYKLVAKEGSFDASDPVGALDCSVLQENLLAPVLGIGDPRTDERIDFIGGIRGLAELDKLVKSKKWAVAFAMFPTGIDQLMAIADAGKIMPPKSTWFEPKLRSGMVVHLLD
ncbi:MAG TPA: DUF1015 domain-containing protein [candidate division Zixibacteria bacterium]|nr:DUF1015 domain-containing protein [candidate division Zixibacteria bacterium]